MIESSQRQRPASYRNRKKSASAAGAALVGGRWRPENQEEASAGGAALSRMRKRKSGGRRAFCQCGTCRTCQLREWKRESRARLKKEPKSRRKG